VDGLKLSRKFSSEELIAAVKEFDSFKPDDVIIGTYPKTGGYLYIVLYIAVSLDIDLIPRYKNFRNGLNFHKFKYLPIQVLLKSHAIMLYPSHAELWRYAYTIISNFYTMLEL